MKVRNLFVPVVAGLLLSGAAVSQAQTFTFSTSNTAASVGTAPNGGTTVTFPGSASVFGTGDATAFFLDTPGGGTTTAQTPTNIRVFTITPEGTTGTAAFNDTFNLAVTLLSDSGTGVFNFTGLNFQGTLDNTGNRADNVFFSNVPNNIISQNLGGVIYSVQLIGNTPPGISGNNTSDGTIAARVTAVAVPEPGSVALMIGMGISGSAFVMRRRRAVK